MSKKLIPFLAALILLLAGCGGEQYEPFKPLSQVTPEAGRIEAIQDALGMESADTSVSASVSGESASEEKSADTAQSSSLADDPYFAEVGEIASDESASTDEDVTVSVSFDADEDPFAEPTAEPAPARPVTIPTVAQEFTAVNPYGTNESGQTTYTLQEGEDIVCLGRRFGISVSQLLQVNNLEDVSDAGTGSVITLPKSAQQWKMTDGYGNVILQRHPAYYVVQDGDTMFSIACAYGNVRPEAIAEGNDMKLGEPLTPGTQIYIP